MNQPSPSTAQPKPAGFADLPVLVMGLGRFGGGLGAARYLAAAGARVTVTDLGTPESLASSLEGLDGLGIETVLGSHRPVDFERTRCLVVANPAVPASHPLVQLARSKGARITTEIELFLCAVRARTVCVTGTQGKSSTCHILAGVLEASGQRVHLGGNIGRSLLEALPSIAAADLCVLELSSYQLELLENTRAAGRRVTAVAVTNVERDHLERHGGESGYRAAKARILELARAGGETTAILPAHDRRLWDALPQGVRGVAHGVGDDAPRTGLHIADDTFRLGDEVLGRCADLRVPGRFQRANALVALGLARVIGVDARRAAGGLASVRGLEHRLEDLGLRDGRRVHDNGVSTTPDSTIAALRSLPKGCTLLAGGQAKGLPLEALARAVAEHAHALVTFGRAAQELADGLCAPGLQVCVESGLEAAVKRALALTPPGADLLFSPACASFDAYPNFRARALAFRAALPPESA